MSRKEQEAKILEFWQKNSIFTKSVDQRPDNKPFIFYDGPPFATGLPHYGHLQGLTCKDAFPRFWTMRGYKCERRWGWDCHGLPIENIAERELGIKEKKDIVKFGVPKFNEFCRSKVLHFADEWKKTVDRVGIWMEFDNSYKTMDNSYMESVWHIFKTLHDKGYIYEGKKVLMYCPHCETPLAKAEIAMDNSYKDVTDKTATVRFKLKNEENTSLLAWTTTPWTLIGNAAIAINEQLTYVKVKQNNEFLILAKDRVQELEGEYEVVETLKGKKLVGKEYEPLYDIKTEKKGFYVINGGSEVSAEEGTGLVHMAAYGEFDYDMALKYDLPVIQHISSQGHLKAGPKEWHGLWFKKVDKKVLEDLEERNLLYKSVQHTHAYPFCYRCDTPLIYNPVDSWFVNIQKIKSKLLERNEDINWYPKHLKHGRFKDIVESAPDWSISRNRFWATSLPVWKCDAKDCDSIEVIGSIKELQEKATSEVASDVDLHKHVMDTVKLKCTTCSGEMSRIPEVIDCWFESGSMPYAAKHYPFENKEWLATHYPCDFVTEYVGQLRAWFYYMHAIGVLFLDRAPFRNIKTTGNVLAADGSKMSKSKKNFPDPAAILDQYGADALRFYLLSAVGMKAQDLNFKEESLKEVYRKVIVILSNVKRFYGMFSGEESEFNKPAQNHVLDKWITSKLHQLIRDATHFMEDYETIQTCTLITKFIDDLSTWYVRRSRDRFKSKDETEKSEAVQTLGYVLYSLAKIIAPFMPFLAEEIHEHFRHSNVPESVHLDSWPVYDTELINEKSHQTMQDTREVVSLALKQREDAKIPIRQALQSITVIGKKMNKEYNALICDEMNIKEVLFKKGDELAVELDTNITPELEQEGAARELIRNINKYRKELGLTINDVVKVHIYSQSELVQKAVERFSSEIGEAVQGSEVVFEEHSKSSKEEKSVTIKDEEVLISLSK